MGQEVWYWAQWAGNGNVAPTLKGLLDQWEHPRECPWDTEDDVITHLIVGS